MSNPFIADVPASVVVGKKSDVLPSIKDIVLEMDEEVEKELAETIEKMGKIEEVLHLATCYGTSYKLLRGIWREVKDEDYGKDVSINGGWWYSVSVTRGWRDKVEEYILKVTDGVVDNIYIFVVNIV